MRVLIIFVRPLLDQVTLFSLVARHCVFIVPSKRVRKMENQVSTEVITNRRPKVTNQVKKRDKAESFITRREASQVY